MFFLCIIQKVLINFILGLIQICTFVFSNTML